MLTSSDAVPSPYRPRLKDASARLLTAVVTNTWSAQTMGLECANPGMRVFHRTWVPCAESQLMGSFCLSATPEAAGPRNAGQFCAAAANATRKRRNRAFRAATVMARSLVARPLQCRGSECQCMHEVV